eukprot:TRINITY_DN12281_c0_g1_i4.p1 TRINITY_DN12281_c0_g1~~TRINITY_DN12281_c0_g1_i4.p1  ORF type:complete len:383 (+),score=74.45 TRINITY_DN12281_c0_g1_i4:376-1524(+)
MAISVSGLSVSFRCSNPSYDVRLHFMKSQNGYQKPFFRSTLRSRQRKCYLDRKFIVKALDAVQPYDYESKKFEEWKANSQLKIGIVGFGNYGQFLAKTIINHGHTVLAYSRTDYSDVAQKMGVQFFCDPDDFCEEHPEVILLCTSIISTESVLRSFPTQRLKRSTLFVDVLSVKEFPRNLFLRILPPEFDVLCTHPMFGPQSGKAGWGGLPFVYDKVRVGGGLRAKRCDQFLEIFAKEGCRMVEMSCAEHDRHTAESQFITHTVGRMLGKLNLESTPINTKGYETLLQIVENTAGDSFDLYYGLFMYNVNATEQLERLEMAFDSLRKQIVGRLHEILRKQLFGEYNMDEPPQQSKYLSDTNSMHSEEQEVFADKQQAFTNEN